MSTDDREESSTASESSGVKGFSSSTVFVIHPFQEEKKEYAKIHDTYDRGLKNEVALKFRKGACANCGSMTHKRLDCMERPRKIGAKFTGRSC